MHSAARLIGAALADSPMATRLPMVSAAPIRNMDFSSAAPIPTANPRNRQVDQDGAEPFASALSRVQGEPEAPPSRATPKGTHDSESPTPAQPKDSPPPTGGAPDPANTAAIPVALNPTGQPPSPVPPIPVPPMDLQTNRIVTALSEFDPSALLIGGAKGLAAATNTSPVTVNPQSAGDAPPPALEPTPATAAPVPAQKTVTPADGTSHVPPENTAREIEFVASTVPDKPGNPASASTDPTIGSIPEGASAAVEKHPIEAMENLPVDAAQLIRQSGTVISLPTDPLQKNVAAPAANTIPAKDQQPAPTVDASQQVEADFLDQLPPNALAAPIADAKKAVSTAREAIIQQIGARLPAFLNGQESNPAVAASARGTIGDKPSGSDSRRAATDSNSQNAANNASNAIAAFSASQSTGASEGPQKNQPGDPAAAAKSAEVTTAAPAAAQHVPVDVAAQPTEPVTPTNASRPESPGAPLESHALPNPATVPAAFSSVVQASQLYQRVGGAEMRIAMQTDLLGAIELHTVVHQSTFSATIGVQRAEVQSLLSSDLPALQHALAQQKLQVQQISVHDNSVGSRAGQGGGGDPQHSPKPAFTPAVPMAETGLRSGDQTSSSTRELLAGGEYGAQISIHV